MILTINWLEKVPLINLKNGYCLKKIKMEGDNYLNLGLREITNFVFDASS